MPRRSAESLAAEAKFRARLDELGATLLEPEWLGKRKPHRVRCAAGHESTPLPANVNRGAGICRVCAGCDRATAEAAFRARVAELGGVVLGEYCNSQTRVHVRCGAGHESYPCPGKILQRGYGICRTCAERDPVAAEAAFRARLAELGVTLLETEWLGANSGHRAICAAGHDCMPLPATLRNGGGPCLACVGHDPVAAAAEFNARIMALGAVVLGEYRNAWTKVHVRCAAGHDCYPAPASIQRGGGVCRLCKGITWDAFYVVTSAEAVKFGITSGDPRPRLRTHARAGFTDVMYLAADLPDGVALDAERAVLAALADAGEKPLQGREYFDTSCLGLVMDVAASWLDIAA